MNTSQLKLRHQHINEDVCSSKVVLRMIKPNQSIHFFVLGQENIFSQT